MQMAHYEQYGTKSRGSLNKGFAIATYSGSSLVKEYAYSQASFDFAQSYASIYR